MENSKVEYSRDLFKRNTLANELFRLDFYPLENFDTVLEKLEIYFREKNYNYTQTTTTNITFDINDPEPLITQSFLVKKNIEIIQNYEFVNTDESCKFVVNQNMLIFDKRSFSGYKTIEQYFEIFIGAIEIIKSVSILKISRIGIRKINELILSKKERLVNYFNNVYLNDVKKISEDTKEMVFEYSFRPFYNNEKLSFNKNIKVIKGKFKSSNGENIDAYSMIWDIDVYRRFFEESSDIDFKKMCNDINNKIFHEYSEVISNELYNYLTTDDIDDSILGGINNGAN